MAEQADQRQVLAAEQVAAAGPAPFHRPDQPLGHVADVDQVEGAVHPGREPAVAEVADQAGRRRDAPVARARPASSG